MSEDKETPERMREGLRQEEVKKNPTGNMNDALNRAGTGNLADVAGSLGWKGLGILILIVIMGVVLVSIFFK